MASTKTYTAIFVVLMALSTTQAAVEWLGFLEDYYWETLGVIMVLSTMKALAVAGYYMHLRDEPRSITYVAMAGLIGFLALTAGASYSII
ncbi:cytochrome c oxidase subunit 4 [Halovenus aranensis]|uniref:Cytochrome c oxidase subunit 4 n=1 Tax=Halovenus aranensis TaxID=890420 RepID=A0A1G8VUV8_9EURY|nr:cytochrome C oxidase subunit IV family protein [Halovenus aranensis]SDJ69613.1 cytochrome c oxidase subunit 4 [Halovenus aranensis]